MRHTKRLLGGFRRFRKPARLEYLDSWLKHGSVRVLDVGCGGHSPSLTKEYYPNCRYYGLDCSRESGLDRSDFDCMEQFYEVNLRKPESLAAVPERFFDVIIMAHVLEHLEAGEEVVRHLAAKLADGGVIYIETPSPHSVHLPSMKGTLNFYDDSSHVRLYRLGVIRSVLSACGCRVIRAGFRHSPLRMLTCPFRTTARLLTGRALTANIFWDILFFASYLVALRPALSDAVGLGTAADCM